MGCQCNCLNKKTENSNEKEEKQIIIDYPENLVDNPEIWNLNPYEPKEPDRIIFDDSSLISKLLEQTESIFEYFEELRTNPEDYEKDAEEHQLSELLQKVQNSENACKTIILNSFLNLLFNSYVVNYSGDDNNDNLIKALEKEEKLKDYNQKLYSVEADISKPNEVIWKLIEDNKDIAYETFFFNDIDYLLVSCVQIPESKNYRSYFLFLKKKEKKK